MARFSIEEIMTQASHRSIPILTLDERYNVVMPDKEKTPRIRKLEAKVNTLLKKQGKVTNDIKELKKIKQRLIQSVVENMDGDGADAKHQAKMNKAQKLIQDSNAKLESLEDEEREIPRELREANLELMLEFVQINYEKLNDNREDIELLNSWINDTRVELKKRLLIKQEKELQNNNIYTYMHDLLGPDLIEMFDKADENQ